MDCSICMESVNETTTIAKTECGHTFHFQCLFQWARKHNTCPLCRGKLAEDDVEEERNHYIVQYLTATREYTVTPVGRPIEEFVGEFEERDIELVMRQTHADRQTAETYLRYHGGDIVDTILCLCGNPTMPIPPFRGTAQEPTAEAYVSRAITERVPAIRGTDGYESA